MRFILCLFGVLFMMSVKAQINEVFQQDTLPAEWHVDASKWVLVNKQLRSNSTTANDTFYISTRSHSARASQWEFYANLRFNTSGTNYTDIFLTCNQADLKSDNKNGYFVRIGGASDEICLYRRKNGTNTKIIDGENGITNKSNNTLKIKVTRTQQDVWTLKRDVTGTGFNYVTEGVATDSTFTASNYFGIMIRQSTASFHLKHFYDDIEVRPIVIDSIAPEIRSLKVISANTIRILYDKYVDAISSENPDNYIINNEEIHPELVVRDANNPMLVTLKFSIPFADSMLNTLYVKEVKDFDDNVILPIRINFTYYAPTAPHFKDVVINELLANPSPVVGLPEAEFVELFNKSNKRFSLKDWHFADAVSSHPITPEDDSLYPGEYIIICSASDSAYYNKYGRVLAMKKWPTLNNVGDNLYLSSSDGFVVDSLRYTDKWYNNNLKKQGGWTLELINPNYSLYCPEVENWTASENITGGTPGKKNASYSVKVYSPDITEVIVKTPDSILLVYNKAIDSTNINLAYNCYTETHTISPVKTKMIDDKHRHVLLLFSPALQKNSTYTLLHSHNIVFDCEGTPIRTNTLFTIPEEAQENDLIINEILSNPLTNGVIFVEIYNRSSKVIDLKTVFIAPFDSINQIPLAPKTITSKTQLIFPGKYLVISKNKAAIKQQYTILDTAAFLDIASMPTMNISRGAICLVSNKNILLDHFIYDDKMHYPLINNTKGVSLERIDFNESTNRRSNWHSAAQTAGFSTPGYENSQYVSFPETQESLSLYPELFSPDEDGINDVLGISYFLKSAGYSGSITIYDSNGLLIKELVKNELLGRQGIYTWDGTNNNREKARIGAYIIFFQAIDLTGDIVQEKKVCVLGGRM